MKNRLDSNTVTALFSHDEERGVVVRAVTRHAAKAGDAIGKKQVEVDGKSYSTRVIAWILLHGEEPSRTVLHLDGDASNFHRNNLMLAHRADGEAGLLALMPDVMRLLSYCPISGEFRWAAHYGGHSPGDVAGWSHSNGYLVVSIFGVKAYAHRLSFAFQTGSFPAGVVDHINGDRKDNRISNLRDVSHRVNAENRISPINQHSASGLLGVHWSSQKGRWSAQIKSFGRKKHLGFFDDKQEAQRVYIESKRALHEGCTL
jgi:hypothetical protein